MVKDARKNEELRRREGQIRVGRRGEETARVAGRQTRRGGKGDQAAHNGADPCIPPFPLFPPPSAPSAPCRLLRVCRQPPRFSVRARACSVTDLHIPDGATTSTILRVGFKHAMSSPSLITCGVGGRWVLAWGQRGGEQGKVGRWVSSEMESEAGRGDEEGTGSGAAPVCSDLQVPELDRSRLLNLWRTTHYWTSVLCPPLGSAAPIVQSLC
jgi:hypothetical protein